MEIEHINFKWEKFWYMGSEECFKIAKRLENKFWGETFQALGEIQKTIIFAQPESIMYQNVWSNFLFLRGNKPLCKTDFPECIRNNINQVGDFFSPASGQFLSIDEFNEKYQCNMNYLVFQGLKNTITNGINSISPPSIDYNDCIRPRLPALLQIFGGSEKGCQKIYRILNKKALLNATQDAEIKWHHELNAILSIKCWEAIWKIPREIDLSNKQKYLQIQINNHVLPTNYSVSKYNPLIDPRCSFCGNEPEKLSHLFYDCQLVRNLYSQIQNFLIDALCPMAFTKRYCLLGYHQLNGKSRENMILSLSRCYIWKQKAKKDQISLLTWKTYLKHHLELIKESIAIGSTLERDNFDEKWGTIFLQF